MKKLLIVEDDPIVAHIYKTRLEKESYEVEIAPDGQSGFYRIHEFHPDVVLLDLMLPKMNGVEILKKIRAQPQFVKVPIIVFTNAYVPNMINESFQAGATHVFNKATLTPRQIIEAIHNALYLSGSPGTGATPSGSPGGSDPNGAANATAPDAPFASLAANSAGARAFGSPAGTAVLPATAAETASDTEFQSEMVKTFLDAWVETVASMRRTMQDFSKAQDETRRLPHLFELYRKVHALTGSAGMAALHKISQMAAALEVLLKELHEKPKNINASTLRTVAHAIDFIGELCNKGADGEFLGANPINILVVDDEILSRRAITYALEKANLKSTSVEEPQVALNLMSEKPYDLVFLDVQMPGMDGFEVCTKIRTLPLNKTTPVIFVTSLTDFKSRARSSLSGGTDLIAKPFMFIELSVKALTYLLRSRLTKNKN
jgi:DNA-binding response OmpR family regulator/HPt (histidine-containing phosphotransfer) domain-containing protein